MRVGRVLATAALAAVLATPVAAQQQQTFQFTSPGSVTGFGFYVGPYQGQILSMPGQPTIDLYCVDFLHRISVGQVWEAYMSPLSGDLSYTRGGNGAYGLYLKAAWLTQQYARVPTSEYKNIQAAIWNLFAPTAPDPLNGNYWLNLANQHYSSLNPNYFYVVTAVNKNDPSSAQEFLTYVTPEPETYALLAFGLMTLSFVYVRRRRQAESRI